MITFSQKERDLIELVPFDTPISSTELITLYYGENPPLHARPTIIGRLRGIVAKCEELNLDWTIEKTVRSGPIAQRFKRVNK